MVEAEWDLLLGTLAGAVCASHLTFLGIVSTELCPASMGSLSTLLTQDKLPLLRTLSLRYTEIGDDGVAVLAEKLLAAPPTSLKEFCLENVGMGDRGLAALASMIRMGRFEGLESLKLSYNEDVTDEGICVLAQAVEDTGKRGLAMLSKFVSPKKKPRPKWLQRRWRLRSFKNCPRLTWLGLSGDYEEMVAEMARAAGCSYRLRCPVWLNQFFDSDDLVG